ncbi:MAG: GRP family sugar transporter [Mycoplasmataceae bacterium]|nr:GRP family sugar transporter [Mycoplasmataceae bacterium]
MWILVGLIPAVAWGMQPIVITKIGGRPVNQIMGTTFGTFWISLFVFLTMVSFGGGYHYDSVIFWTSFASGIGWCVGQILQYTAFKILGVAKAMPLSTGLQLILINIFSVTCYGDWRSSTYPWQIMITGFAAIILIIVGVIAIAYKQKTPEPGFVSEKVKRPRINLVYIILIFAIGTVGYLAYFALGELPQHLSDFGLNYQIPEALQDSTVYGFTQFFPQAIGMVLLAILFAFYQWFSPCFGKNKISLYRANRNSPFIQSKSYFNMIDGLVFSSAALSILLSKAHNGVATGTSLSQTNIIIATLGGLFILKEHKPKRELICTLIGLGLVVTGGIIIGLLSTFFPN